MLYAVVHDALTWSIGPEYFERIKGLEGAAFFPEVVELAAAAGWTAGLAMGVVLLVANNPSEGLPQLDYTALTKQVRFPFLCAILLAFTSAALVRAAPSSLSETLVIERLEVRDPLAVTTVWAMHTGTYVGAVLGLVWAVVRIRRARRRLCVPEAQADQDRSRLR